MKRQMNSDGKKLFLSASTEIRISPCAYSEYITEKLTPLCTRQSGGEGIPCRSISFSLGIPTALRDACIAARKEQKTSEKEGARDEFVEGTDTTIIWQDATQTESDEAYAISFGEETRVYANAEIGFLRALSTVMTMADEGTLCEGDIYDTPACPIRGYRVYMPGRETMGDFIKMLDFLVYYKYNSLILEVGGAMEYKRHPRINEKWVEFCRDMNEYSGKSEVVQNSQHWAKNSIHSENGDGAYLSQEECRRLAEECRRRGIELIPECPTLSHADYICLAYPELAERREDPYPDTYCPSNPESYRVVFDILDEVIEVFEPKSINIGHDECYSICLCDRCRGKDEAAVYAEDVRKIKEYLESKGVSTLMWAEKLLKARYTDGSKIGGWYEEKYYNGVRFMIPWMFRCADMLPEGVTYLHWYWSFGEHLDDEFHARKCPVVFGNFEALKCKNYRARIRRGVLGGFVSNWGSCAAEYMQRNLQYHRLVSSALAMWSDSYDTADAEELNDYTLRTLYAQYSATVKHPLRVVHTAHHSVPHSRFWCGIFIEDAVYLLGHYELTYEDGTTVRLPVKLGTNVGPYAATESDICEAAYSTMATPSGEGYMYEHLYENPYPAKKVVSVNYVPMAGKEEIRVDFSFPEL